jgi:hypothetical protein
MPGAGSLAPSCQRCCRHAVDWNPDWAPAAAACGTTSNVEFGVRLIVR